MLRELRKKRGRNTIGRATQSHRWENNKKTKDDTRLQKTISTPASLNPVLMPPPPILGLRLVSIRDDTELH